MLVMDSGLGGLSVVRAVRAQQPTRPLTYLADTGFFPYGVREAGALATRAVALIETLAKAQSPGTVILACNTLSTLCLADLRAALPYAFVGTVPAVKVAASQSATKRFTLLATPNTAQSEYTRDLIAQFAEGCRVDSIGAPNLAQIAEAWLLGAPVTEEALRAELAPAFLDDASGKTDAVVLGCTHYPLMVERLRSAAPWPVKWIDSGEAIARRALSLAAEDTALNPSVAYVTRAEDVARYRDVFLREGFDEIRAVTL